MKKKSIQFRVNVLILFFILLFLFLCLHSYFNNRAETSKTILGILTEIEKDFSAAIISENASIETLKGAEKIQLSYEKLENTCSSCHSHPEQRLFKKRYNLFYELYNTRRVYRQQIAHVRDILLGLIDSVSYIHEHHIVYLKNLLNTNAVFYQYRGETDTFEKSSEISGPETDIIKTAVEVQGSLVNILKSFNDLQLGVPLGQVREEFTDQIRTFFQTVKMFEDYSLDAQDGILVEELLLEGRSFEGLFTDLLLINDKKNSIASALDKNRKIIFSILRDLNVTLEKNNRKINKNITFVRLTLFLSGMLLVIWIIVDGTQIIKEIKRTADETRKIQKDFSYEIEIGKNTFDEFKFVYQAMNSMAARMNSHVEELQESRNHLEKRFEKRTRDLFRTNENLRNEIKERRRTQGELVNSRERLSLALDISGAIVWEWNETHGELYLEDSIIKAFLPSEVKPKMTLKTIEEIHDRQEFMVRRKKMISLIKGEIPLYIDEHRIRSNSGEWRIFRVYGKVVEKNAKGRTERLLGTAIDITEQKRVEERSRELEKRLQQVQKMEAIGTLAGGIAHDFNNILGGILGYAQLAKRESEGQTKLSAYLDYIIVASNRAKELIRQIMAFSRKSKSKKEVCNVQNILNEVLKLLRASIPMSIQIEQNLEPGAPNILADQTQIHQVVMNLCTNAYQAMEESGGILQVGLSTYIKDTYRIKGDDYDQIKPGSYVKLSIRDTGCGMDENTLTRIFEPYFTTKEGRDGIGLGLATVHGIIEAHGGNIVVKSKKDKGTTFEVFLPAVEKETSDSSPRTGSIPFGTETILAVDDEFILADVIKNSLEDLGYQVVAKTDPNETLEIFRRDPDAFDLIILDYIMPGIKGDMLSGEIIKIRPDIPIILCTGLREPLSVTEASKLGIREILTKPVDINFMALKVREILDQVKR